MESSHWLVNGAIFVAFYMIALLHHGIFERKELTLQHHIWAAILSSVASPALRDAVRDFVVHLVVYSGYVFPAHM